MASALTKFINHTSKRLMMDALVVTVEKYYSVNCVIVCPGQEILKATV